MIVAEGIILIAQIYCVIGLVVALAFISFGLGRVELAARGAFLFRLQIIPGLILLWPIVIVRWIALERSGEKILLDKEEKELHEEQEAKK
ncbi:hypothetical protein PsW64_05444 [Pseudovibrio sp. W64]|uniref:hypothetical protein n=1 Tax=unclassified Pseudovibrio TaxID=2627060 RepID=UPI00070D7144|nr:MULTISPECIES: hypothetical protein [unclassified Pseudovibrio]KZK75536.1 hypothetical protein PsW64_05444 [Pseudovibrio sp. W64]KZK86070.1 hypothetical protein PsAD13_01203 [Pseudovibrio sp. Ad13]KZK93899.1 hypothetical protein PsAD46_01149 [Pseudovibrio sp. Ad46]KZL00112.1 hypothetical protein PsAD5_01158 [Pseudovibrio sp. Ad5]KZL01235.1 hypothetical protein PsW74_02032 [Pseudovibrio sp. W74]